MKKKMMTAVLAMTMVATAVAGCGSSSGSGTTVELTNEAGGDAQAEIQKAEADQTAAEGTVYKVGIVQYVDDASLNQIEKAIEAELTAKGAELGVTFDYADYTFNGQADQSILTQIAADLVADDVDLIIPIATPTAVVMQSATEENQDSGCIFRGVGSGGRRTGGRCERTGFQYYRNVGCHRHGSDF